MRIFKLVFYRFNIPDCKIISLSVEKTNSEVMELLHKKIKNGEYSFGETIVPQTFTKTFVKDGKIKRDEISVSGRKFSLIQIRKDLLQKHSHDMRLTTDEEFSKMEKNDLIEILKNIGELDVKENQKRFEDLLKKVKKFERTRYLVCWHDGSSVGNHSHLLVTVYVLYDTVSFLSDNEYYLKHKKNINAQASVEEPNMYILVRCPSTDQQLLYSNKRIGDIMNLKYPTKSANNVEVNYILRFFKGDSPARHDGSSVGNHSHLLVTVYVLYDTVSFLSDNEYYLKHKKNINAQASVEEPNMYILVRCPSTDQQLLYSNKRIGDIMNLKYPTKSANNVEVNYILRFFKGDSSARQFEGGQQKGGNFFCVVCPVLANHVKNIADSNIKKVMSIKDRIKKVKITTTSVSRLEKNTMKLYENMKKNRNH